MGALKPWSYVSFSKKTFISALDPWFLKEILIDQKLCIEYLLMEVITLGDKEDINKRENFAHNWSGQIG